MTGTGGLEYTDWIAEFYDTWFGDWLDSSPAVDALAGLAGSGRVLELGIGTGRVALRLLERGVDLHGIDASEAMVARLRAKPGGDGIPVTIGDFSELDVSGRFSLVYLIAGSFFELQSQAAQVRCFQSVARHLEPGGVFVLDGLIPETGKASAQPTMGVIPTKSGELILRFRQVDRAEQRYVSHYAILGEQGVRVMSVPFRYAAPSELDLMAGMAGLRLRQRTGGWKREPFTSASDLHVSVYEAPG